LLSTIPLDVTLTWLGRADLAARLTHSSSHIIGLGLRGVSPHDNKCWMYYPEDDCPFYRCTVFSLYAKANVPDPTAALPTLRFADGSALPPDLAAPRPGPYWSLMFEVSESAVKPVDLEAIVEDTIRGALNTRMIADRDEVVSVFYRRLEYGYPTPSLDRDAALAQVITPSLRLPFSSTLERTYA
jgi:hypothetical protein